MYRDDSASAVNSKSQNCVPKLSFKVVRIADNFFPEHSLLIRIVIWAALPVLGKLQFRFGVK
ncbi:hypothetical protein TYRP_010011 [Tyrophagus putrescentiae]|nr:hypothetical protein TYRP_010011 [Tyrophagus putrescentiae]